MAGQQGLPAKTQRTRRLLAWTVIFLGVVALSAICLHSLEEIHYLKGFFPQHFTVEEAFYAAALELVKILILAIPILVIIGVALFWLGRRDRHD